MSRLLLLVALALGGCDDEQGPAPNEEAPPETASPEAPELARLFPLSPGDRWRISTGDGAVRVEAVTGVDSQGIAIVHGTGHVHAERYARDEGAISLVGPEGERLSPVLRTPLRPGARFDYELREREVVVRCEVEVTSIAAEATVAGAELTSCVDAVRRCLYPAGAPFSTETTHTREERYCPGVGLVGERAVFRPAPSPGAMAADRHERVVGFRVSDGAPPPARGCARYVLVPSDVGAACGPDVGATSDARETAGVELPSGACRYRYRHGTATLEAVVGAPADDLPSDALVDVTSEGRAAWLSGPAPACPNAERLAPLLSSLLG